MTERPPLNRLPDGKTFRAYYYMKEELAAFCRENRLPASGSKAALADHVARFLDGEALPAPFSGRRKAVSSGPIPRESHIEENFVCSEAHRAFFLAEIGKSFSFRVPFQRWLKANPGKTYAEAVEAYRLLLKQAAPGKTEIGSQFEYNQYIRDFFRANPDNTLPQAIACWQYKKRLPGSHRYDSADLIALTR